MKYHCKYVWTDNKKCKRKAVIINSLYTFRVFSSLRNYKTINSLLNEV